MINSVDPNDQSDANLFGSNQVTNDFAVVRLVSMGGRTIREAIGPIVGTAIYEIR